MKQFRIKEWHRTVVLLALLSLALGFLWWSGNATDANFVQAF